MKMSDVPAYKGDWLKASDVTVPKVLTIKGVRLHQFEKNGLPDVKAVMDFMEVEQAWVINVTGKDNLCAMFHTDESDHWVGKQITLMQIQTNLGAGIGVGPVATQAALPPQVGVPVSVPMPQDEYQQRLLAAQQAQAPQPVPQPAPVAPAQAPGQQPYSEINPPPITEDPPF